MAWDGYLTLDGNEIINVARTEQYVQADGNHWFRPLFKIPELAWILGDVPYRNPLQDVDCPWFDPDDADSQGFYGLYPTNVDGLENSTRTSTVVEYTSDGGTPGRIRHATRAVVVSGLLLGQDDAAVDYGMRWLRNVLLSGDCRSGSGCSGATLCYMNAEPAYDPTTGVDCGEDYLRFLHRAVVNNGPTITAKHALSDGAAAWEVQFTIVVGVPWEFGQSVPIVRNAYVDHVTYDTSAEWTGIIDNPANGWVEAGVRTVAEQSCADSAYVPVFDPLCPDLVLPPSVPQVPLSCFTPPKSWHRRAFQIPADAVPQWSDMVPLIEIAVLREQALRNLRLRLWANPDDIVDPDSEPCGYCADILVTYVPVNSTMVIDGRDETVLVTSGSQVRRADGLVLQSNGRPISWPALSCGIGYVAVADTPITGNDWYSFDFYLVPRNR